MHDARITSDPKCEVACDTSVKDNMVTVTGETTVVGNIGHETAVRGIVKNTGLDVFIDD